MGTHETIKTDVISNTVTTVRGLKNDVNNTYTQQNTAYIISVCLSNFDKLIYYVISQKKTRFSSCLHIISFLIKLV